VGSSEVIFTVASGSERSLLESYADSPLPAPNYGAGPGTLVGLDHQNEPVRKPERALNFNGGPCCRQASDQAGEIGPAEPDRSGFEDAAAR
jgi:hypothetical protein